MTATTKDRTRALEYVSDGLGPAPVLAALCLAGWHDGRSVGSSVAWGLLALGLLAVLPYAVTRRMRHPPDGSMPSRQRKGHAMALVAGTAAVGLAVLVAFGAPGALVDCALAIVATLCVVAIASALGRWSNHAAACAGGVAMSAILGGSAWLCLAVAVLAVGTARVQLGRHIITQVVFGAVLGGSVGATVLGGLLAYHSAS